MSERRKNPLNDQRIKSMAKYGIKIKSDAFSRHVSKFESKNQHNFEWFNCVKIASILEDDLSMNRSTKMLRSNEVAEDYRTNTHLST